MRYNTTCSKCGKPQHHKQLIFQKDYQIKKRSAFIEPPKQFALRLCSACIQELMPSLISMLMDSDFKHFIERNGEEIVKI
jgi:hypothetical protein